jgi:PEP-CTERM motif
LVLTGNNTYGVGSGSAAGPGFYLTQTVVNAGALQVNGQTGVNSGTGGSTVVVNNAGTVLGGTGQIIPNQQLMARNTVTINSGAVLSPGLNTPNPNGTLTPGILTVGSSATPGVTQATVTETAGSYFRFLYTSSPAPVTAPVDTGGSQTPGAAGNNELLVHGALVLAGGLDNPNPSQTTDFRILGNVADFPLATTVPGNSYSFQIAQADAGASPYEIKYSLTPSDFDVSGFVGFTGQFDIQVHTTGTGAEFVNFTPVPEPSTLLATGAAAIGLAGAIRRRRKTAAAKTAA